MIDVTLATSIIYWVSLLSTMCCNSLKIGEGFRSYPIGKCFNQRSLTSTTSSKRKIIRKNRSIVSILRQKMKKKSFTEKWKKNWWEFFFWESSWESKWFSSWRGLLKNFAFLCHQNRQTYGRSLFCPRLCLYEARLFAPNLIKSYPSSSVVKYCYKHYLIKELI